MSQTSSVFEKNVNAHKMHHFVDINIDSEVEENDTTNSTTYSNFTNFNQNNSLDFNNNPNNNNNNNNNSNTLHDIEYNHSKNDYFSSNTNSAMHTNQNNHDRKSIFKFSKGIAKVNSQSFDKYDILNMSPTVISTATPALTATPGSKPSNITLTPNSRGSKLDTPKNNLHSALKKFSPINKSPPSNNLTLSQAADILLNEISRNCYLDGDESDEEEDEEDDEDDDELDKAKGTGRCLNQSDSVNSFDSFLNSSTISSVGGSMQENTTIDISLVGRRGSEEGVEKDTKKNDFLSANDMNRTLLNANDSDLGLGLNSIDANKTPVETDNDDEPTHNKENQEMKATATKTPVAKSQSLNYRLIMLLFMLLLFC